MFLFFDILPLLSSFESRHFIGVILGVVIYSPFSSSFRPVGKTIYFVCVSIFVFSKLTVTSRVESREVSIFLLDFKEFSDLSDDCDLVLILCVSFSINDGCDKLPVVTTLCDLVIMGVGLLSHSVFFGTFISSFFSKSSSLVCDLVTILDILSKTDTGLG